LPRGFFCGGGAWILGSLRSIFAYCVARLALIHVAPRRLVSGDGRWLKRAYGGVFLHFRRTERSQLY